MLRRIALTCAAGLLLATCTSCDTADLDQNGDGQITRSELVSAALDLICGDQDGAETPDDGTTDGGAAGGDSTGDESAADEAADGGD